MSYLQDDTEILNSLSIDFDYGELDIAPNNHYIEAAKCFITKLDEIIYLLLKKEKGGRAQVRTSVWALALALGSKHLEGQSMTEIAAHLDVTRAAVSKQAVQFSKLLNLPPSPYMAPARKGYGKETELKKAKRMATAANDHDNGVAVVELTKRLIDHNIERFKDGRSHHPVECWGRLNRRGNGGLISSVFIKNQYIEKMFNGSNTQQDIVKAWVASKSIITSNSVLGPQINRSVIKKIGGEVHRGYVIRYDKVTMAGE
jgi:hypothetical protein